MKKIISLMAFSFAFNYSFSQTGETLQSITDRGSTTNNIIIANEFTANGQYAGFNFKDRNIPGRLWTWYSRDASARLFNSAVISDLLTIQENGNVGIGTSSPAYKLDVNGNGRIGPVHFGNTVAEQGAYVSWNDDGGGGMTYFKNQRGQGGGGFSFQESTTDNIRTDLMRISSNGNVGIGTVSPAYRLDVNGGLRAGNIDNYFLYNGLADVSMRFAGRGEGGRAIVHGEGNTLELNYGGDFSGGTSIGKYVHFAAGNGVSYINTGNLGIGTLDPGPYKLAVEGTIGARKVKVTQQAWSDYVFDSSYQLPSLSHVEAFIKENKHLPEVPSAAEVKKDGIDLGDNQATLLKKIEELTLYIIQQNKEIQEMKKEMGVMKASLLNSEQR